jgi:mono/diheme cytochrome c family protein
MRRSSLSTRKLAAFGSLLAVAVAVSACGGSSGSSSTSSEPAPATTQAPATSAPATTAAGGGGAVTAAAGKKVFTANCGSCHTLADAGTSGNVGPNLDDLGPDMATVVHQVTNGGGGMPSFASQPCGAPSSGILDGPPFRRGSAGRVGRSAA